MSNQFQITKLPTRAVLQINGQPVVLNQFYDNTLEGTLEVLNPSGIKGEPFDTFVFKIKVDDILSKNNGIVTVNFPTNKLDPPIPSLESVSILIGTTIIFSDFVLPNDSFDRIKIKTQNGFGEWLYKGSPIVNETIFMYYDLGQDLIFQASDLFPFNDYSVLEFQKGTVDGFNNQTNSITVSTTSLGAELAFGSYNYENNTTYETHNFNLEISKGLSGKVYSLEVIPQTFILGSNPLNKIIVKKEDGTVLQTLTTNNVEVVNSVLSSQGKETLTITIETANFNTQIETVKLNLLSVDGNTSNINQNFKEIILNIPITNNTN